MADDARRSSPFPTGVVAAVVFVAAVAVMVFLFRDGGDGDETRAGLEDYDPAAVEEAIDERLEPVRLTPSTALRITGRRIEWRDAAGRPFLETPRVSFTLHMGTAAAEGGILIADGVVEQPRLRLVQIDEDAWNYQRTLAPLLEDGRGDPGNGGGMPVRLRNMALDRGYVRLDLLDATYEARSVDVALQSAHLSGPGLDAPVFHVARAGAELVLPDTAGAGSVTRNVTLADATLRLLDGAVAFDVDAATFGESRLADATGVWDPARGGLGLDARLRVVEARVADLPWLPGEVPEGASGSFMLRLEPRPGDRTAITVTEIALSAPGSSASGMVRAVIGGAQPVLESVDLRVDPLALELVEAFTGPLPYGGAVSGTIRGTQGDIRFDLTGQLTTATVAEPFRATLAGSVGLSEEGVAVHGATVGLDRVPLAALDAIAPGLPFGGTVTGTIDLSGTPGRGPLELDLRLEAGGGIVTLAGTADISGPVPVYDVSGRLVGVRLQSVLRPAAPPVDVHATFDLEGRGTDPATATASIAARGTFTGWQTEPGDTLVVRAQVAAGRADVEALRVQAGPVRLAASGEWDFVDGGGSIQYDLAVSNLEPLGRYLPADPGGQRRFSRGTLKLSGTAAGTLEAPVLSGQLSAREFRWGEWAASAAGGEYSVDLAGGLPRIDAEVQAEDLRTPAGDFQAVNLMVDFGRPTFAVSFAAQQTGGGGVVQVTADGRIEEAGQREVFLRTVEVDLEQQRWRLQSPAEIAWTTGDEVRVQGLELVQVDGDGRMRLGGIVAPLDDLDLSLDVAGLPVGEVLELAGLDFEVAGELNVDGRLAGPTESPELDVRLGLTDGAFRGVGVTALDALIRYDRGQLVVDGDALLGDSARVEIDGSLPARIRLAGTPLFTLVDDAPLDLRLVTRTFPLSTLDPGVASAEDLQGRIQADLVVTGTPSEPRLSGSAQVTEGAVTVPLLDQRFTGIRGTINLSGRQARVRQMVIESDGTATVEGTLTFDELTNPALSLAATLDRFRVQGVEDETSAGVWGTVRLDGTLRQPVVTGAVRVDEGAVSLAPLQQPELSTRLTGGGQLDLLAQDTDFLEAADDGGGLIIRDLDVTAGDALWFVTDEARVRLGGTLTVNQSGQSMAIQGLLQGEGGSFQLSAGPITRVFQIVSSEVRFFGSPDPNPRLAIVAERTVRVADGGDVDIRVLVGGTLNNPSLNLASGGQADLPESELLSFLLFGRNTADLGLLTGNEGLGGLLTLAGVGDYAAALGQEIGFVDYLRVEYLPGGDGTNIYTTAGKYATDDLLVEFSFITGQNENFGAALEYDWDPVGATLRAAWEPVERVDRLVGYRSRAFLDLETQSQFILIGRRRWTY